MSFVQRQIDLKFELGKGSFGDSGFNTVSISGLRASATIAKTGGVSLSNLDLRVYGMSLSNMNALSTLGKPLLDGRNNKVTVTAGDAGGAKSVVFSGIIQEAWADPNTAPDVAFLVQAYTGLVDNLKPLAPVSYPTTVDAATVVSSLATQMGYAFENSGVSVQLSNAYFWGTGRQQLEQVARHGGFNFFVDDVANTVAIWPKTGSRNGAIPLVNAQTGMVGYPQHTQNGIIVTSLFNPNIVFGRQIKVESVVTPASGTWTVFGVTHDLESETPGGKWFTQAQCTVLGHTALGQ